MVEDVRRERYGPGEYGSVCDKHDRVLIYRPLTRWTREQALLDCPNGTAPGADLNAATRENTATMMDGAPR